MRVLLRWVLLEEMVEPLQELLWEPVLWEELEEREELEPLLMQLDL